MGRFTKLVVGGLTAALVAASGAFADFVLTDFDKGGNESNMGTYFYLYSAPDSTKNDKWHKEPHWDKMKKGFEIVNSGGPDEYGPHSYTPPKDAEGNELPGYGGGGLAGGIQIRNLPAHDEDETDGGFFPGAGFGIMISDDDEIGIGSAFASATSISFKTKVDIDVTVIFVVETIENAASKGTKKETGQWDTYNPANSYATKIPLTAGDWQPHEVKLTPITEPKYKKGDKIGSPAECKTDCGTAGDLQQLGWWGQSFTFNLAEVTKIAWKINADENDMAIPSLDFLLDDIVIKGFNYVPEDECTGCDKAPSVPTPAAILSLFEGEDYVADDKDNSNLQNARGYYWFYYLDKEAGGTSSARGLECNPGLFEPDDVCDDEDLVLATLKTGRANTNGAYLGFTMGTSFKKPGETTEITPFAGIGANLCWMDTTLTADKKNYVTQPSNFFDATKYTGVYFEYKTTDIAEIYFEVTDDFDAINRAADNDGEVLYTKLAGTSGEWKGATVPFSKLVLPKWAKTNGTRRIGANTALNLGKLSQIKFKYQGLGAGTLAIDNVYFYGSADPVGPGGSVGVKHVSAKAKVAGMRATYSRGVVGVNFNAATSVASGKISLVNTKGRVVASAPIAKSSGSKITAKLGASKLPTGMYFVRVNAKDVNGKKIVQNAPISIVK